METIVIDNIKIDYSLDTVNGNCHVVDSYKITSRSTIRKFITSVMTAEIFKIRSTESYLYEWKAHNVLYKWNIKIESTKDVDLNIGETMARRIAYFILSFFD